MTESLDALVGELQGTLVGHRNQFVQWLQSRVQGTISIHGPDMYDNGKHEETYIITLDETALGEYRVEYVLSDEGVRGGADGKAEIQPPRITSAKVEYRGTIPGYEHPFAKYLRLEGRESEVTPDLVVITVFSAYDGVYSKPHWTQPAHGEIPFRVQ